MIMSREFDDIRKKIDQSHNELYDMGDINLVKELYEIKKEVKDIAFKVDTMLEILNNFSIMLVEDDEDMEENYVSDEDGWASEQEEDWDDYSEEEEEE